MLCRPSKPRYRRPYLEGLGEEECKGSFVKEEGVVPPMPPDAYVKVEIVVKEEEGSGSRPKRRRTE